MESSGSAASHQCEPPRLMMTTSKSRKARESTSLPNLEDHHHRRRRRRGPWIGRTLSLALIAALSLASCVGLSNASMSPQRKTELRDLVKKTWYHGFDNYIKHAYPDDELRPLSCKGIGHDHEHPNSHETNDVLGDFSMTLIDVLDTFVALRDVARFRDSVRRIVTDIPSFDIDSKVQVFETTIRVLGGLLSGHLFAKDPENVWGFRLDNNGDEQEGSSYADQLLFLAKDLADRLMPAFHASSTGIPYARINLRYGLMPDEGTETCTAGAGSLLLEFATLSRLLGDPIYENVAKKAFYALWDRRSSINLLGNTIDIQTGHWSYGVSSIGAGIDSFYEYILKSHVLLSDDSFLEIWNQAYKAVMTYMRSPDGFWYRGVNMQTGAVATTTIDSLSAFWPGLQVLAGDIEAAIQSHMTYANLWARYSGIPEVFDIHRKQATSLGYPLRPEFVESNYFLYRATKDEYYLEVAERVITDLVNRTWVDCGLASIENLLTGKLEDRQHSFMLSETLKYLYLTFDEDNPINHADQPFVFTTEGHILYIPNVEEMAENQGYRTGWEERESLESDRVVWESHPTGRRQQSTPPTCSVYSPSLQSPKHSNPLMLSITGRTDFDYAKMITGSLDSSVHPNHSNYSLDNQWASVGFCEVPVADDDLIELIFSHSADEIERSPGAEKVEFFGASLSGSSSSTSSSGGAPAPLDSRSSPDMPSEADAFVLVKNLTGLTFSLKKRFDQDSYEIVKVGSFELSAKTQVVLSDPYAVKVLKPQSESEKLSQRDRDHLTGIRVYYEDSSDWPSNRDSSSLEEEEGELDSISRPVMLATFGPDVRIPGSTGLSIGNGALEVVGLNPPNEYGCEPITQEPVVVHKKERPEDVNGKVVLVKRGQCTFADKVQNALLAGAKALIVANQDDTLLIPTSDRIQTRDPKEDLSSTSSSDSSTDHQQSSSESHHRSSVVSDGDNKDLSLNLNLQSIPLLFCTLETGRSIGHLLANRHHNPPLSRPTPPSPQHPRSKKLLLEIVHNPLDLLDHLHRSSHTLLPQFVVINGYKLANLHLKSV
ncbi:alpha mannosidase-like protein [Puccinia graminis f. sp. tritici]|uniref:alpha-1,2-Mannosidase n=1 Tax=Puccinia graminis f. sp. tritici TaxID=56615 RepID=A0A5B0ML51_PUCGR|nr:alpha mannosidase-like protein [Puccinia graminis f. sp. tritici]KAA1126878.1 alpha mannosidase-like protein [Puccinia graminis f. sp. tritici]